MPKTPQPLTPKQEQQEHEMKVCGFFLSLFNMSFSTDYKWIRPGVEPEPDCICNNGLNVEITSIFYSTKYAENYMRCWQKNISPEEYTKRIDFFNERAESFAKLIPQLFKFLNDQVKDKLKKSETYRYNGKLILVINGMITLTLDNGILDEYFKNKPDFKNNLFSEIWLLCGMGYNGRQSDGIVRLDLDGPNYTVFPETHHSKYTLNY